MLGSESGQVESVKLLHNMVSNRTIPPPLLTHCICKYSNSMLIHTGKGGRGGRVELERRLEGQQFTKLGRKPTGLNVSPVYKLW
jgi:hypothetical protein